MTSRDRELLWGYTLIVLGLLLSLAITLAT